MARITVDGVVLVVGPRPAISVPEVARDVEEIMSLDALSAHAAEDALWEWVLRSVAAGHPDSQALAVEALKTADIEFPRWYA